MSRAFGLDAEIVDELSAAGVLQASPDGLYDLVEVAASLYNHGVARANLAEAKLAAVANALHETLPALQRLAGLPDATQLEGEARERVTLELSVFFTSFSELLARATEALKDGG